MLFPLKRVLPFTLMSVVLLCVLAVVWIRHERTVPEFSAEPNPAVEEGLFDETFPVPDFVRTGAPITLGGDGVAQRHRSHSRRGVCALGM